MPYYKNHMNGAILQKFNEIKESIYEPIGTLNADVFVTPEPVSFLDKEQGEKITSINEGEKWGKIWDCGWFHITGEVSDKYIGSDVVLMIDISGEAAIFDDNGCPIKGLTCVDSGFELALGLPGKRIFRLATPLKSAQNIDLWMDAGCNDLFGEYRGDGTVKSLKICKCFENRRKLFYDMQVLIYLKNALPENSARYNRILFKLFEAVNELYDMTDEEVAKAIDILAVELDKKNGDADLMISAIGHAHMDLAWLWPIRETVRKGARTFATVIDNMERYPEYLFGASQPQLFDWIKIYYPELYGKIKEKVKERRLEPQGAMWVEADTNVSSGEALVRQIMYGKKFYKDEFEFDVKNLWLPDVFGYNGALPQILKKSNIDYFMTQKLSWSEHNKFPHQTFIWQGIDGTEILTHMLPEETYNSGAYPTSIKKIEENYKDVGISDKALMLFGIGDGGGGPNTDHIERLSRMKNLSGIAPIKQQWSADFFTELDKDYDKYKKWFGELYLEKHQGTLTTQAKNKWFNRKIEQGLRELEFALTLQGEYENYPKEQLDEIWKEVLLYQFHDIIPGSSIDRVYDESVARYEIIYKTVVDKTKEIYQNIANKVAINAGDYVIFNSLSWVRNELVKINDTYRLASVPALGYTIINDETVVVDDLGLAIEDLSLENKAIKVIFAKDGSITSIYNKELDIEAVKKGTSANVLAIYEDKGDCWDIPITYQDKKPKKFELVKQHSYFEGKDAIMEQEYKFNDSVLTQKIILGADKLRVDFDTKVDWKENNKMLRTSFATDILVQNATFDIQFGNIKRSNHENTTYDMAQFEVCAIKWADVSSANFGVALISDSKYGYNVKNSVLDLNLLRSARYPGRYADIGTHQFIYSIYPHPGNEVDGQVSLEAYEQNIKSNIVKAEKTDNSTVASSYGMLDISGSLVVEAVKKAEESNDIIIRMYEFTGAPDEVFIKFSDIYSKIILTNLMEEDICELSLNSDTINIKVEAFEIVTLRLVK